MRYMLVTFLRKPNGQIDEQVGYSKRIRKIDEQLCNIIIDYKNKTLVKSVVDGKRLETNFDKVNMYYKELYPELIELLEKHNS